jgi:hypothetical protein
MFSSKLGMRWLLVSFRHWHLLSYTRLLPLGRWLLIFYRCSHLLNLHAFAAPSAMAAGIIQVLTAGLVQEFSAFGVDSGWQNIVF